MRNNDISNIINTAIVSDRYDVFWKDDLLKSRSLPARPVLFITVKNEHAEDAALLQKIIDACKLTPEAYNLLELHEEERIAWHILRDELNITTLVLFGIGPEQLGVSVHLMPHQTNRFDNCNWIPTASMQQMAAHPEIKTHLWNYGLKPVFIDKIYS